MAAVVFDRQRHTAEAVEVPLLTCPVQAADPQQRRVQQAHTIEGERQGHETGDDHRRQQQLQTHAPPLQDASGHRNGHAHSQGPRSDGLHGTVPEKRCSHMRP